MFTKYTVELVTTVMITLVTLSKIIKKNNFRNKE